MPVPANPKIYHIAHVDRLPSILHAEGLLCDARVDEQHFTGTSIGMSAIKQRRLRELTLTNYPDLHVGGCVPFYFCPRSIMLYVLHKANDRDLTYRGGQAPIVHLEADLRQTVSWAEDEGLRWVFTLSNAGTRYFEDRCQLDQLDEIDWVAVQAVNWQSQKEGKQAEFLVEERFPWHLVTRIGVQSAETYRQVDRALQRTNHRPKVKILPDWYY